MLNLQKEWHCYLKKGNSKELIKQIPDDSIDFLLTDSPYNIGKHSTGNIPLPVRTQMNNAVADWDWVEDFLRVLKTTGNLFIFTSYNQLGRRYNCLDHRLESSICMAPERLKEPKRPAQKPVPILKKMITIASNENDIILDPFMGVGSTGVAALELNRKFIGFELDDIYFQAGKKRIMEYKKYVPNL